MLAHDGAWEGFVAGFVVRPADHLAAAVSCNQSDLDPTADAESLITIWRP